MCVAYLKKKFQFFFCLWLNEVYILDFPGFLVVSAAPSPPLPQIIESTLHVLVLGYIGSMQHLIIHLWLM